MKQLAQDLRSGKVELLDVPEPKPGAGQVLVRSRVSLVSPGTERALLEFGRSSFIDKARSQPEKVRQVFDKIRADGLLATVETVLARLDEARPLGYCNAGVVVETGPGVTACKPGDRVASNGPHAELILLPETLCCRIPDGVPDDTAAFTVLGAVALEGQRLLQPTLGESVAVVGLGLVGLLAVQLLQANGCRVIGFDPDAGRRDLARGFGAEVAGSEPDAMVQAGLAFTRGRGLDAVLITASAPQAALIRPSARMSRKRGRVVLTGVVDMEIDRSEFYERELSFQVSCSYGPGRYERAHEERGLDYPLPYVRWTEARNFEAFLDQAAAGRISIEPLVASRVAFERAIEVYDALVTGGAGGRPALLLTYGDAPAREALRTVPLRPAGEAKRAAGGRARVGVIGAGLFARLVILPALRRSGADLRAIASRRGLSAVDLGRKFGFARAGSQASEVLDDPEIDTVFIVTRHDSHASLAAKALENGKHVFLEKPLAIRPEELDALVAVRRAHAGPLLTVGFNRDHAPLVRRMQEALGTRVGPASLVATVNAGALPEDHWLLDPAVGGGRLIGEGCHWLALLVALAGVPVRTVTAASTGGDRTSFDPSFSVTLGFSDGSIGTLHYLTRGHRRFAKERVDVFYDGRVLSLDNFRSLAIHGGGGRPGARAWRQDKGHDAEVRAFLAAIAAGGPAPIPFERLAHVTRVGFAAQEALRTGGPVEVPA